MSFTYKQPVRRAAKSGPRAVANEKARKVNWPGALRDAGYRCVVCCERKDLVGHHAGGRPGSGLCLGAWANAQELLVPLCAECHDEVHASSIGSARQVVLLYAVEQLAGRYNNLLPHEETLLAPESVEWSISVLRSMVRTLEERGVQP